MTTTEIITDLRRIYQAIDYAECVPSQLNHAQARRLVVELINKVVAAQPHADPSRCSTGTLLQQIVNLPDKVRP